MSYNIIKQIYDIYQSNGINFADGLRLGNYTSNDIFQSSGVGTSAVMAQAYKINAKAPNDLYVTIPIQQNKTTYIPLGSSTTLGEAGASLVDFNGYAAIKLDVSRTLKFLSNKEATITVSGFDDYNQKLVAGLELNSDNEFSAELPRAFRYFTNIACETTETDNDVSVQTGTLIELAFTDYGVIGPLISNSTLGTLIGGKVGSAPPYRASPAYVYETANWSSPLTLFTGKTRPLFSPKNFTEDTTFNIFQPVYGYGYLPNMPNNLDANPFKDFTSNEIDLNTNNNLTLAIGIEQYFEGWKPWAG